MIRKIIIVALTLAAVGTAALGNAATWWRPIVWTKDGSNGLPSLMLMCAGTRIELSQWYALSGPVQRFSTRYALIGIRASMAVGELAPPNRTLAVNPTLVGRVTVMRITVSCPWRGLLVLLAAYPTMAFIRDPVRRYRRRKRGLCVKCGYDLTGNVTGVCSECGESVP